MNRNESCSQAVHFVNFIPFIGIHKFHTMSFSLPREFLKNTHECLLEPQGNREVSCNKPMTEKKKNNKNQKTVK